MTEPHYTDDRVTLFHGDCRAVLAEMEPNSVDCVVTDPPYDLTNRTPDVKGCSACGRTLGGSDGNPEVCPRCGGELSRQRSVQRKGFMGKSWDGTGVAFDPATWEAVLRVLKPGGFLAAFGGTRTQHRMVCAIEDAGFEIRDSVSMIWAYGSGFPKGQGVLKPAVEPVALARKPFKGTAKANVAAHGTGALNIDGCRVATGGEQYNAGPGGAREIYGQFKDHYERGTGRVAPTQGRWPANLLLVHNPDCVLSGTKTFRGNVAVNRNRDAARGPNAPYVPAVNTTEDQGYVDEDGNETTAAWVCTEGCPAALIDSQSGDRPSAGGAAFSRNPILQGGLDRTQADGRQIGFGDKGGASRFFSQFGWDHDDMVPVMYSAKAPSKERPFYMNEAGERVAHSTVKPLSVMRWLIKLVAPPGGVVLDPFTGSGTTIEAALLEGFNAVGVEMTDEYLPLIEQRINRAYTSIESTPEPDPTLF